MIGNGNGHSDPFSQGGFNVPPEFDDNEPPVPGTPPKTWKFDEYVPTASWWVKRKLPDRDYLMEGWLSTTSRILLCGPSGVGKTNFNLGLLGSLAGGLDFLHWRTVRPGRVLLIDGEMPRELTQRWVGDTIKRLKLPEEYIDNLIVLSREDYPDMPPLNTPEGQQFLDQFLAHIGPVDLISFDNIQALLKGNMKETEQWEGMLDYNRELTSRKIAVIWNGHTNTDGGVYGDKTREWQMESLILLDKSEHPNDGIAFNLKFSKARIKTPENRHHFVDAMITLDNDEWSSQTGGNGSRSNKPDTLEQLALAALDEAIDKGGEAVWNRGPIVGGTLCVTRDLWLKYFEMHCGFADEKTIRNRFSEAFKKLQLGRRVGFDKPYCWKIAQ